LRARAGEILTRAETFRNADSREKMRKIAASYEKSQVAATARIISSSMFAAWTKTSKILRQTAVPSSDDGIGLGHRLARLSNGFLRCHSGFRHRTPHDA
jgi:hypothetical protein